MANLCRRQKKTTYLDLHVKCPDFFFARDFNQIWIFSRDFHEILQ